MRSIPAKTVEYCRSAHDAKHQGTIPHSTGGGDIFGQLARLSQERDRLERRLHIWLSQKERTEAQIAAIAREEARLLNALEPQIRGEGEEARTRARPFEPVPLERRSRAV